MQKLSALLCLSISIGASELVIKDKFSSHKLGELSLIRTDKGYDILKGTTRTEVKPYDVDSLLKKLDKDKLEVFINEGHGYPEIIQLSNGDYKLKAHVRAQGGGEVTGKVLYWTVKGVCWGVLAAGAAVGIATVGKEVAKAVGPVGEAIAKEGLTTLVTSPGGPGAPLIAQAINANEESQKAAVVATTAAIVAGAQRTVSGIETAAEGARWLGRVLYFLP